MVAEGREGVEGEEVIKGGKEGSKGQGVCKGREGVSKGEKGVSKGGEGGSKGGDGVSKRRESIDIGEGGGLDKQDEEARGAFAVQLQFKSEVCEQMKVYKQLLERSFSGQNGLSEEKRRDLTRELLQTFEAGVQSNVLINGLSWDDAPDIDDKNMEEVLDLETQLDNAVLETAQKRRKYPKLIQSHVLEQLKAQRREMELYEERFKAEEVCRDPDQGRLMEELNTAAAAAAVKQAARVIESISLLHRQSSGLLQVVNMKSSQTSSDIHQEVLGPASPPAPPETAPTSIRPVKRVVMETTAAAAYRPLAKKPELE